MSGEDSHLEAEYEDRNGDPHGVGSPEWDEDPEYDSFQWEDEEPNPYHGTYSEE